MHPDDLEKLKMEIRGFLAAATDTTFAIIGHTPVSYELSGYFAQISAGSRLLGVYSGDGSGTDAAGLRPLPQLTKDRPDFAVIASDGDKERLIETARPFLSPATRLLLGGYGHFQFRHEIFDRVVQTALIPSLANGYPYTLVHLFQCLENAARLGLKGVVAEFGMFKGGTTLLLSHFIAELGQDWPVIGFDTFAGFPARRDVLDLYAHPDCVFRDEVAVRRLVADQKIEVVAGDVVATAARLAREDVVLAFIDTDNYTSACAILDVIQGQVVVGGAIVFDHFTGRNRHLYTLGERIAAKRLLADERYFNLHDTGVFIRQGT